MEILNKTALTIAHLVGRVNFPGYSLTLIVKGTFDLNHEAPVTISEEQLYPTGDELYPGDESQGSVRYESDFAYFKPNADLLLVGKCHTPQGIPLKSCAGTFQVGGRQSTLAVIGNRYWHPIVKTISSPEPFTVMNISYDSSFGGIDYDKNPAGIGYSEIKTSSGKKITPLPNIENTHQLINSPDSRPEPGGFGPLNKMWQQRFSKMGTYKENWMKERWPWFPVDFSWEYYNAAPRNMQVNGYLEGDESFVFNNLHPEIPVYHSQLPGLRIRCFLNKPDSNSHNELDFSEVKMNLDTLWVDMEAEKLVLVWRGVTEIQTEDYDELKDLFVVSEQINDSPRSKEDYQRDFQETLAEEDTPFEEDLPEKMSLESTISIEEEIQKAELEVEKAQVALEKKLKEAGIEPIQGILEPSQEDKEMEARILAEYGLDEVITKETLSRETIVRRMMNNESFAEEDFSNLNLSDMDLRRGDFKGAVFSKVNLKKVLFDDAILTDTNFENADLSEASLKRAKASGADFTQACLNSADLSEATLSDTIFDESMMIKAILDNTRCPDGYFSGADLSGASLKNGMFDGADFSNTLLNGTNFHKASLKEANLNGAKGEYLIMNECDLTELRASGACCFVKADFRKVKAHDSTWEDADLGDSDFSYSDMKAADFSSAILKRTKFLAADMKQARFIKANLASAICVSMNLFESSFEKANLMETDFTGSNLYGTEFLGAKLEKTIFQSANLKMTKLAGRYR